MSRVLVLLSTYNGEKYLHEQLDSLYSQNGVEVTILARDDGSSDNTLSILQDYSATKGSLDIIKGMNVGAASSFYMLIKEANLNYKDYDYYAFCDQDDVWLNDKLNVAVRSLDSSDSELKLYCGHATPTDQFLNPIKAPQMRQSYSLGSNIVASRVLGCTMVFNKRLLFEVARIIPSVENGALKDYKLPLHDGWTSLVAYALGADVITSNEPYMYYRQHGGNVVGSGKNTLHLLKARIFRYLRSENLKSKICEIALRVYGNDIPEPNRTLIRQCANYRHSFTGTIAFMFNKSIYQYGLIENVCTFFMILLHKF